ncbi:glycosyltransferase [Isoptericola variabilis]|uniref:glycosyltransferase n=1 Tax=Isoptericola variabilis TaxID=139208 RepID=UPI00163E121C|nr:glycosyltransferase [Isoptericola variabilis]
MTAADTTQVHPTRGGAARDDAALDVVSAVTGALPVRVTVTAVVVTRGNSPFLAATLEAVAAQSRVPDDVVVVDVDASRSTGLHTDLTLGGARYVAAGGSRSFGTAVDAALAAVGGPEDGWLWLLHDDSAPAPDALARLLRAVEHSGAVAVAGCKQRSWPVDGAGRPLEPGDGTGLLAEVGYTVSPLGRRMTGIDRTEIDQGQHDAREDVLAVGLAGALVRRAVWDALGGTDPEVGPFGDSLDLCRRARLAGHRVVVVPEAVVHHAQASLLGLRERPGARSRGLHASEYARRRAQLYQRLVFAPLPLVPVLVLAMVVWAPFAAMYRLALKRPAQARDELVAPLATVLRVVPLARARRQAARTATCPRRVLRPLLGTWREVVAERRDRRLSRAEAYRNRWSPSELERAELRRLAHARRTALALVVLAVVALAVVLFGSWQGVLAAGGRVVGGALLPAPGTLGDLADAATSGWVRDGLGAAAPADPLLLPLTALTALVGGSVQTAVNALVVAALPLAPLGGWFRARTVTRFAVAPAAAAACVGPPARRPRGARQRPARRRRRAPRAAVGPRRAPARRRRARPGRRRPAGAAHRPALWRAGADRARAACDRAAPRLARRPRCRRPAARRRGVRGPRAPAARRRGAARVRARRPTSPPLPARRAAAGARRRGPVLGARRVDVVRRRLAAPARRAGRAAGARGLARRPRAPRGPARRRRRDRWLVRAVAR